ncbi:MAG: hypothetical protein ACP6IP_03120 [Candidatus Njordarchaeia archaeon]
MGRKEKIDLVQIYITLRNLSPITFNQLLKRLSNRHSSISHVTLRKYIKMLINVGLVYEKGDKLYAKDIKFESNNDHRKYITWIRKQLNKKQIDFNEFYNLLALLFMRPIIEILNRIYTDITNNLKENIWNEDIITKKISVEKKDYLDFLKDKGKNIYESFLDTITEKPEYLLKAMDLLDVAPPINSLNKVLERSKAVDELVQLLKNYYNGTNQAHP